MSQAHESDVQIDPSRTLFGITLDEAFDLTEVRSIDSYERLKKSLPDLRGASYFFVNVLDRTARLMATVIVADEWAVTTSFALDHQAMGIDYEDLVEAACNGGGIKSGNYPISEKIERKIKLGIKSKNLRRE
jgi:hypothetical protein